MFRLSYRSIIRELVIVGNKLTVCNAQLPDDGSMTQPKRAGGCVNKVQKLVINKTLRMSDNCTEDV
jgi:hypothetical protein